MTETGCIRTVSSDGWHFRHCGRPAKADGLCSRHLAGKMIREKNDEEARKRNAAQRERDKLNAAAPAMLAALEASEREYREQAENAEQYPADPGCLECTVGTVPDRLNTGLCAHHLRVAAIALATKGRA